MRDSEALDAEFVVYYESGPEIGVEKVSVHPSKNIKRQWSTIFLNFVHLFLKLGKHRLAKEDLADVLDLPVDEVSPHQRLLGSVQKMVRKELFVKCRSHFGEKNRVAIILEKLMFLSEPAVHGMSCLVGKREHVGKDVGFVVHQDIRRLPVTGGGECSASLPFGLITVDPTGAKSISEGLNVFGAERTQRLNDDLGCFIKTDIVLNVGDQGYERVILMDIVQFKDLLPEIVVLLEHREIFSNRRN
jgi:hypothetical protein